MKKIVFIACSIMLIAAAANAQKYAIIDTKYILDKLPDYKKAQADLDVIAAGWQKEIDSMQAQLDKMYKDYDAEQVMLSEELRKKRQGGLARCLPQHRDGHCEQSFGVVQPGNFTGAARREMTDDPVIGGH